MNILEFAKKQEYPLTPVQKIVLKLFYGLPLDDKEPFILPLDIKGNRIERFTEASYVKFLIADKRCRGFDLNRNPKDLKGLFLATGRRAGKNHLEYLILMFEVWGAIQSSTEAHMPYIGATCSSMRMHLQNFLIQVNTLPFLSKFLANKRKGELRFQHLEDILSTGTWKGSQRQAKASICVVTQHSGHILGCKLSRGLRNQKITLYNEMAAFQDRSDVKESIEDFVDYAHPKRFFSSSTPRERDSFFKGLYHKNMSDTISVQIPLWEMRPFMYSEEHISNTTLKVQKEEFGAKFLTSVPVTISETVLSHLKEKASSKEISLEDYLMSILEKEAEGMGFEPMHPE